MQKQERSNGPSLCGVCMLISRRPWRAERLNRYQRMKLEPAFFRPSRGNMISISSFVVKIVCRIESSAWIGCVPQGRLLLMVNSKDDALKQETVLRNEMLFRRLANQETALRDERCYSFVHTSRRKNADVIITSVRNLLT
jgi:hypothetical protein